VTIAGWTFLLSQQQDQHHPHQLDSTVNDLVDQFGDTGVEGEFPQARKDDEYTIVDQSQPQPRSHPQRLQTTPRTTGIDEGNWRL